MKEEQALKRGRVPRVLFICTGNICRSPTAEGVLRELSRKLGIELHVESAGTHHYHVGEPPDRRAVHHASGRGYDLSAQRARQLRKRDFEEFDLLDRKSTRLNSSHSQISYAVFC